MSKNTGLSCLYKPVRSNILGDNFGTVNTENLYYFNLPFTLEMVQKTSIAFNMNPICDFFPPPKPNGFVVCSYAAHGLSF